MDFRNTTLRLFRNSKLRPIDSSSVHDPRGPASVWRAFYLSSTATCHLSLIQRQPVSDLCYELISSVSRAYLGGCFEIFTTLKLKCEILIINQGQSDGPVDFDPLMEVF
ncbi:hypothetical protein AB4K20DRAFT_1983696 [Rhizopus microsporus]